MSRKLLHLEMTILDSCIRPNTLETYLVNRNLILKLSYRSIIINVGSHHVPHHTVFLSIDLTSSTSYSIPYHYKRLGHESIDAPLIKPSEQAYELRSLSLDLALEISLSVISLSLPVLATPPVMLAATTSFRYPIAPDSAL